MPKTKAKVEEIFRMTHQKSKKELVHPHWHPHFECIKVITGGVLITVDTHSFYGKVGDIVVISGGCIHSVHNMEKDADSMIMGMVFDTNFLTSLLDRQDTQYVYDLFKTTKIMDHHITPNHPLWHDINASMEGAYKEYSTGDIMFEMAIKSYVYQMVTALIRHYKHAIIGEEAFSSLTRKLKTFKPVFDYIDQHYAEKIYIEDLSSLIAMSESHFTRTFKKITSQTPMGYINHKRINIATHLLIDTDKSIAEIAELTGFCNINYFDTLFKKRLGMTPLAYRNQNR